MRAQDTFVSIHEASRDLGLPLAWLKREAEESRIPSLKVGRQLRFNVAQVERALKIRAAADGCMLEDGNAADLIGVELAIPQRRTVAVRVTVFWPA